jgi:hypothetical protein
VIDEAVYKDLTEMVLGDHADSNAAEDVTTGLRSWFFSERENSGPNGWDRLVGDDIECHTMDTDHLLMVAPPQVSFWTKISSPFDALKLGDIN